MKKVISNYGGMSGYTVYKTNDSGTVSINQGEMKGSMEPVAAPSPSSRNIQSAPTIRDTFEPSASSSQKDGNHEELRSIRKILEEISSKLSHAPEAQNRMGSQRESAPQNKISGSRPVSNTMLPPIYNNNYQYNNPHYGFPAANKSQDQTDGQYNVMQACKNLHQWARTEYNQTEGFDTTYSPQELRDRISILGEIENQINSVAPSTAPPVQGSSKFNEKNLTVYKAMKKDPDRITRRTYFEATI
ncbi:MAG: hypothetical protein RDV48_06590 [Candidatus Eremiobacteraeota bacterium]|nr:hypothetical protein [Candidatus Eremiobacteraeota bacterium]